VLFIALITLFIVMHWQCITCKYRQCFYCIDCINYIIDCNAL